MDFIEARARYLWGGILIGLLIISLALFLFVPGRQVRRVLFFTNTVDTGLSGEIRYLPSHSPRETSIRMVLDELLLGPVDIEHERLLPEDTRIRSFLYRDGIVYIDFSHDIIDPSAALDIRELLEGVERTVTFNFPSVRDVVITIRGQVPFTPYYEATLIDKNDKINKSE